MTKIEPRTGFRVFTLAGLLLTVLLLANSGLSPMTADPGPVCAAYPSPYSCDTTYSGSPCDEWRDVGSSCGTYPDGTCKYCRVAAGTTPAGIMAVCVCS
ncbi:MAG TPA: hypothetical protein VEL74_01770 [Thermoanaerobaculia bacterium]|nr:hypothetical protein [Thermoanaerobaculia bacterium]